jgi:hypothetical protein
LGRASNQGARARSPADALHTEMDAMRRWTAGVARVALVALLVPGIAAAQMREFRGKVDRINKRQIIVDNRQGDKLKFKPAKDVTVEGEKDAYKRVKKNDWVLVSWKMADNPRVAYKIVVLPDQDEAGADE